MMLKGPEHTSPHIYPCAQILLQLYNTCDFLLFRHRASGGSGESGSFAMGTEIQVQY